METQAQTRALRGVVEPQRALAAEKACAAEQNTPLRLGTTTPGLALTRLRLKGIPRRGLATSLADPLPTPELSLELSSPSEVTPNRSENASGPARRRRGPRVAQPCCRDRVPDRVAPRLNQPGTVHTAGARQSEEDLSHEVWTHPVQLPGRTRATVL